MLSQYALAALPIRHIETLSVTHTPPNPSNLLTLATSTWLPPLQMVYDPKSHSYCLPNGHRFPVSATGVISLMTKSPTDLERIMAYKHIWEPRGKGVHYALESFLKTPKNQTPLVMTGDDQYEDWIKPMLAHKLWGSCEPAASELRLYDSRRNVCGTTDAVVRFPDGTYAVLDLKTQSRSNSSPYDTKPQLGAYLAMLNEHYPTCLFSRCLTLWARPGKTTLQSHDPDECWAAWDSVFQAYEALHRPF